MDFKSFLQGLHDNHVTYVWRMCSLGVMNPLKIMGCKSVLISKKRFLKFMGKNHSNIVFKKTCILYYNKSNACHINTSGWAYVNLWLILA